MVEILTRAQRGDDDRHLPFRTSREIGLKTVVGAVDDLVDRERRRRTIRMHPIPRGEFLGDPVQPFVEQRLRPCVERSEEHTSELQSLMRISYAVFCLKKKKNTIKFMRIDM